MKINVALVVALIAIAAWPKGYQLPCQLVHNQSPDQPASKDKQSSNPNPYWCYEAAYAYLLNASLGQDVNTYPNSEPKQYNAKDGPNYDLYAQKSMAISTERLVVAAWLSLFIGIVGVVLIIKTLAATREAVSVTREIGQKEVRAYLSVKKVKALKIEVSSSVSVSAKIINSGQTPATDVVVTLGLPFYFADKPKDFSLSADKSQVKEMKFPIAPGGSSKALAFHPGQLVPAWFEKYKDGSGEQYFIIVVSYVDVFGERHETGYRGMLNAKSLRESEPFFQLCEDGNYST